MGTIIKSYCSTVTDNITGREGNKIALSAINILKGLAYLI